MQPSDILETPQTSWDKKIAADLTAEMERHLSDKISTIPEMRRILAVRGYRELREAAEHAIEGKTGADALRAMMHAMRRYALERPGLSAATFRTPETDSPEWRAASMELGAVVLGVFGQLGVRGEQSMHALRILRALVRGFVLHEMASSFLEPIGYDESYDLAIKVFIEGLAVLRK
ncbi:MAG: TetR-like C-terminal domain-containing protein [Gemmatimonas sp.]